MKITADSAITFRALADETRFTIFQTILDSPDGVTVDRLSEIVGVHRNTIRPHLLKLEEAGLVASMAEPKPTIGRPRRIYFAADREGTEGVPDESLSKEDYRLLADILLSIISRESLPEERRAELAKEWGHYVITSDRPVKPGKKLTDQQILSRISEHLTDMGFENRVDREGGRQVVQLLSCPFSGLAKEYPKLICHIHKGIVQGMLEALGAEQADVRLLAQPAEGACSAVISL